MTFPECSTQSGCRPPDPLSIDEVEIALHKATFGNKRCPGCSKENWLELNVARQCCQPSATSDKARQRRFSRSQHACSFPTIALDHNATLCLNLFSSTPRKHMEWRRPRGTIR